ncbi:hypothetical protein GUITHDRAFT_106086 [Guillardia theta CCMP2712]|uniref:PAS domain-containing protein n=1 Tax=Guillardia theta (strain CCMP2712) TaxID=905079 RepID=L1JHM7_GUITC|nr:hypothetical protein GUITHDRAFT_106086 [Guillardia theta CCMP2712]EKX48001.1 hypothetical protein GUITHDRAFT_106086 [Guillardia theta CCMP2712]|eukprot:XP_005834981.1 hypothetical protein GUITHDRAFT_106086 [Guillardia theta CCMP2712]
MLTAKKTIQKAAQRGRRRLLIDALDARVPISSGLNQLRSSLASGRTVEQLMGDLVKYVRSLKQEPCDAPEPGSADTRRIADELIRSGMLSSRTFLFLSVSLSDWRVTAASAGLKELLRENPFKQLEGRRFIDFVHPRDALKLRCLSSLQGVEGASSLLNTSYEVYIRTFDSERFDCRRCTLVPMAVDDSGVAIFHMSLDAMPCSNPSPLSAAALQELSGIYAFDEIRSSTLPWDLDAKIERLDQDHFGFIPMIGALLHCPQTRATVQEMSSKFGMQLSRLALRMFQLHLSFIVNDEGVLVMSKHVRLKLPSYMGNFQSMWQKHEQSSVDGNKDDVWFRKEAWNRLYQHRNTQSMEIHLSKFSLRRDGEGVRCSNSESILVNQEGITIWSEFWDGSQHKFADVVQYFSKVSGIDDILYTAELSCNSATRR